MHYSISLFFCFCIYRGGGGGLLYETVDVTKGIFPHPNLLRKRKKKHPLVKWPFVPNGLYRVVSNTRDPNVGHGDARVWIPFPKPQQLQTKKEKKNVYNDDGIVFLFLFFWSVRSEEHEPCTPPTHPQALKSTPSPPNIHKL